MGALVTWFIFGGLNYVEFRPAIYLTWYVIGALNHVRFRAAMYPTWYMAEREGFEPSIPFKGGYSLSRRAPSASRASLRFILSLCAEH